MEFNAVTAGDEVNFGACFLKEAGEIGRGGACAEDSDGAAVEAIHRCVLRAVGDEALRKIGEDLGDVTEMGDAHGDNNSTGMDGFAGLCGEGEAVRRRGEEDDVGLFEVGDKAPLEFQSVRDEMFDGNGIDGVGVG